MIERHCPRCDSEIELDGGRIVAVIMNGRRYVEEQTCNMEQIPECQFDNIACSECGVALWAFSMDKAGYGVIATPNYCPYCGCKVVNQ